MIFRNFIAIDLQNDFASEGGISHKPRPSVDFVKQTLIPYFEKNNLLTAEIVSDYRPPRPGDRGDLCYPGEWGFESIIPDSIKKKPIWIKCMNSPIWVRENLGVPNVKPGLPYQNGEAFQKWLNKMVGPINKGIGVVLFGLTVDCCVLSVAQELNWRGYKVYILQGATDTESGDQKEKEMVLSNPPLTNWAKSISWEEAVR
jgi:nicotinamidase-related amidase